MDNRSVNVVSEGDESLRLALTLIWPNAAGGKASHYKLVKLQESTKYYGTPTTSHSTEMANNDNGKETLILLWHEERGSLPLPYPLNLDEAVNFVAGWLKRADYGRQPDHDGDNGRGFRVFSDFWGHVAGHHYGIAGVQPEWAMYGK